MRIVAAVSAKLGGLFGHKCAGRHRDLSRLDHFAEAIRNRDGRSGWAIFLRTYSTDRLGMRRRCPNAPPVLGWALALAICRSNNRTFVLVANFETNAQVAHYRVTRIVFGRLREALRDFSDVVPQLIGRPVSWDRDPGSVLTWCQRQRKAVLIWGDFDTTRDKVVATAHFQLRGGSKEQLQGWSEMRSPLGDLESLVGLREVCELRRCSSQL
jgi:hypothetical protein